MHIDLELVKPEGSQFPATADGLRKALDALGAEVRFNSRACQVEIRLDRDWQGINPRLEAKLRERIAARFYKPRSAPGPPLQPLWFSGDRWRIALNALLADRELDPFLLWLGTLPPWDGEPRLDAWISECFQVAPAADAGLCAWAARSIPLAALSRAYRPGLKHDWMVVLVGPQGIGKSTTLAWLFPQSDRALWFGDALNLGASDRVRVEALQGRVLVECPEMQGATRADVNRLKSFLSRTDDGGTRLAYRRNPEPYPRRAVIVGMANDTFCLPADPTGNRRFVPIPIQHGNADLVGSWLEQHRDRLWSEALQRYRGGELARLDNELAQAQAEAAEQHRASDDVVENRVDAWLNQPDGPEFFTVEDVARGAGLVAPSRRLLPPLAELVRNTLQVRGCVPARRRLNGAEHPLRCYRRP